MRALRAVSFAAAACALCAAPARAQLEAWQKLGEEELHTRVFASLTGEPRDLFAACDKKGRLKLPKIYQRDYKLTKRDTDFLEKTLKEVSRHGDIDTALEEGYLPLAKGFVPSQGLLLAHPDLLRDGIYDPNRPDILSYVKKKGVSRYRLVGFTWVAGRKHMPPLNLDFGGKSRLETSKHVAATDTWYYEDEMCVIVKPGESVQILRPDETPRSCRDGAFFKRMWRLHTWALVYNPRGLFAEKNTMVDFLDSSQHLPPLCPKPRRPAPPPEPPAEDSAEATGDEAVPPTEP